MITFNTSKHTILLIGLSILIFILPVQTVLVQFFLVKLGLPLKLALWKEFLVGICILILIKIIISNFQKLFKKSKISLLPLFLVFLITCLSLLNSVGKVNIEYILFGFRFELYWVWFWALLAVYVGLIRESVIQIQYKQWLRWLNISLLAGFFVSSVFSILTIFFGTQEFLSFFGFGLVSNQSDANLLFTQTNGHLIDAGGWNSNFRLSGTFSSPNHYAGYLILLLPWFGINSLFKLSIFENSFKLFQKRWFWVCCLILNLGFIFITYSRFSYLALFTGFVVAILLYISTKFKTLTKFQDRFIKIIFGITLAAPLIISVIILNLPVQTTMRYFPTFLAKPSSTEWHQQHTAAAIRALNYAEPHWPILTGFGLGSIDPAAKYLPLNENPLIKLGIGKDDETYFAREIIKPLALTPENWFLGLWLQTGILVVFLFARFLLYFLNPISFLFRENLNTVFFDKNKLLGVFVSLAILGLVFAAFLLDIFDSQALALLIGPVWFFYGFVSTFNLSNETPRASL